VEPLEDAGGHGEARDVQTSAVPAGTSPVLTWRSAVEAPRSAVPARTSALEGRTSSTPIQRMAKDLWLYLTTGHRVDVVRGP
jgi:hypothetical protein